MARRGVRWAVGLIVAAGLCGASLAQAEVQTKMIEYKDGDATLTGLLAWDDAVSGPRPGVIVVHEWWGLNDYAKSRAEQLAAEGYVAFAVDMYGDSKVTTHPEEAGGWMKEITANVDNWARRAKLGLEVLQSQPQVEADKVAAIGYCFGGATVLQMAYAGMELDAVVSFHGSLPPAPDSVTSIQPAVMAAHGRDDAFVPPEKVASFEASLDRIGADYDVMVFSGTRHSFTNPNAADYGMDNIAYNERADKVSWAAMLELFKQVF